MTTKNIMLKCLDCGYRFSTKDTIWFSQEGHEFRCLHCGSRLVKRITSDHNKGRLHYLEVA